MLNQNHGEGTYVRMKQQDMLLFTFGRDMECYMKFNERLQKYLGQLPHLDAPAGVLGVPAGVVPFWSAFFSLTKRSATQHCFDMDLQALLQGKTWSDVSGENQWILWRRCFAHMAAFEMMQAGTQKVCQAVSAIFFDPSKRWHAGQEALKDSKLPEVLLLFQFAWEPLAPFYDRNFKNTGGFGLHAWNAQTAKSS